MTDYSFMINLHTYRRYKTSNNLKIINSTFVPTFHVLLTFSNVAATKCQSRNSSRNSIRISRCSNTSINVSSSPTFPFHGVEVFGGVSLLYRLERSVEVAYSDCDQ
ncbi:hypothetical protein TNIN_493691 [Trichonephila inaurata madagascariensis]|uniref:Uncharacterized protein n=1 Tax=Trichonephila inaurata madagascariensis TaxID=2747483 RepID=A0A8X6X756_9ARAC|nr:hypothetical protein TNIN_493691 [Trichonephila inaurata madagascariensis]